MPQSAHSKKNSEIIRSDQNTNLPIVQVDGAHSLGQIFHDVFVEHTVTIPYV